MMSAPATLPLHCLLPDLALARIGSVPIGNLSLRSAAVHPGTAFLALPGLRGHGLDHARQALDQGAAAVLWDEADDNGLTDSRCIRVPGLRARLPELARQVFGAWPAGQPLVMVTGTDGKTSVTQQIGRALQALDVRCAVIGTLGAGMPGACQPTGMTTPDVIDLYRTLAQLQRDGFQAVALEASSHALAQGRLAGLEPRVAVLTYLGRDHLDYHGTLEAYAAAKARLFALPGVGARVLNRDDAFGRQLLTRYAPAGAESGAVAGHGIPCWSYGIGPLERDTGHGVQAWATAEVTDLQAMSVQAQGTGLGFEVRVAGVRRFVQLPLLGAFQVANVLATLGTLLALGFPLDVALRALQAIQGVPGRMERFARPGCPVLVVDYAHTPDALASALRALRPHARGQLWVIFGCGGDRDAGKRPQMGKVAGQWADRVIVTDDNPRHESAAGIRQQILQGLRMGNASAPAVVTEIGDRAEAIATAFAHATPDDLLLIAGKGHETTQNIAGVEWPYSDRQVAERLLAGQEIHRLGSTDAPQGPGAEGGVA